MRLVNVSKIYHNKNNDVIALKEINLSFSSRGMTFIIGASGCGKTTLLNIIAGYDQDYEGTLETDGKVESIEQEIMLMENMSVLDNLLLVSDDKERINALLDLFQLKEKNKKVKKLSVGEKKRVQIIRSLLTQASYLICDEPTAALDHENGESVMKMLKEISKEIGVIVVTHDIALVEAYSDRVIRMGKGCIIEDEAIISNDDPVKDISEKRSIGKQAELLIKLVKTRWPETLFRFVLLFFTLITVFVLTFLFPSLNGSMNARTNWLNGKNVIVSEIIDPTTTYRDDVPDQIKAKTEIYTSYIYFDVYHKEDAYLAHESIPGILGYRMGWNWRKYRTFPPGGSFLPMTNISGLRNSVEKYRREYEETGISPYMEYENSLKILAEYDEKYPNDSFPKDQYIFIDYSNFHGYNKDNMVGNEPITDELMMAYKPITAYQLFPEVELDLMIGKMPAALDEIVVSKTFAQELIRFHQLSSEEELVGHEVFFQFWGRLANNRRSYTPYSLTVCGITYMDSQLENQIFFMDGGFDQPFIEEYGCQPEIAAYHYLDFLTDPSMDSEEIAKRLNRLLESKESRFEVYGNTEISQEQYQNPVNMIVLAGFAFVVLLFLYLMMQYLLNKRISKENKIMKRYHYHPGLVQIIMMLLLLGIAAICQLSCLSYVCDWLNQLANTLGFANIVTYSVANYAKSFMAAAIGVIALEGGIYAIRTKKYS